MFNLEIDANGLTDLAALSNNSALITLSAEHNRIADLSPLAASKDRLGYLYLGGNQIESLEPLYDHVQLKKISAPNNLLTSLRGLDNCTQLTYVNFNNNHIGEIALLAKSAARLEEAFFENNRIADISPLAGAANLKLLALDGNSVADLSPLRESAGLLSLFLNANRVADIQALSGLSMLQALDLSDNGIADIGALSGLKPGKSLYLDLSYNRITDLSPLPAASEKNYIALFLDGNPIDDYARLGELKTSALTFTYRAAADYSPLFENETVRTMGAIYVVDAPRDIQVDFTLALHGGNTWAIGPFVNYVSTDEIRDYKQARRDELTGAARPDDGESDSDSEGENGATDGAGQGEEEPEAV